MAAFCKWTAIVWTGLVAFAFCAGLANLASHPTDSDTARGAAVLIGAAMYFVGWSIIAIPAAVVWLLTRRD